VEHSTPNVEPRNKLRCVRRLMLLIYISSLNANIVDTISALL
jgi:hypothetical protein